MVGAWRLLKTRYLAGAFDGEGAREFGGRWNSPGVPVVYLAESLALAALEVLVHLQDAGPLPAYSAIPVHFDARLMHTLSAQDLPADWRTSPPPAVLRAIGDAWVRSGKSVVLAVPSAVVESERIFLLNPAHRAFRKVRIGPAQPFAMDARLVPSAGGRPRRQP
jgi:RES domain-containing protein